MKSANDNAALEARAHRAAKSVGCVARKSPWRRNSIDNLGGFLIVDRESNLVVAGRRFDMTAEDVIKWCEAPYYAE